MRPGTIVFLTLVVVAIATVAFFLSTTSAHADAWLVIGDPSSGDFVAIGSGPMSGPPCQFMPQYCPPQRWAPPYGGPNFFPQPGWGQPAFAPQGNWGGVGQPERYSLQVDRGQRGQVGHQREETRWRTPDGGSVEVRREGPMAPWW
jgi:hypothetical protein